MKVKKYVASSMGEAMKQIRSELGSDAVILNSREVFTGGLLGFFKKRNIEVLAAIDEKPKQQQVPIIKQKQIKPLEAAPLLQKEKILELKVNEAKQKPPKEVVKELNELKNMIRNLSTTNHTATPSYPTVLQMLQKILTDQEVEQSIQESILTTLLEKWYVGGSNASIDEVYGWLEKELAQRIAHIPFGGISFSKKFVNVVGPTGVGKTTTLAKIAAECVITHKKKVAFITTDTYRIAAIDQLKTYAKILNVPMEVCYSIDDFKKATQDFSDYDVVLIDTAGRNFRNKQYVEDLKEVIDFEHDMETFLVLSLTSKQRDMEDIFNQFSLIHIDKFIFTKADETSSYGSMYNMLTKYSKGVAYMTNGQNVPDDMVATKPNIIAKMIIGVE
ncbi:flagellar biosynthesis protein FlhF [Bacillus sp. Bva_UNVM-123]|uniref:flagellar biosynthesis protein FlhF n=1 Tax=Bacillus sp. Bva_UNVM-123 TaxID=2829798 RepID=UPI00391F3341